MPRSRPMCAATPLSMCCTVVSPAVSAPANDASQQGCGSPANLQQFQGDYDQINTVLAQQVQTVLAEINAVSPLLADLYLVLGKHEMALIDDGLGGSRVVAWTLASSLAGQPSAQQALTIAAQDALVAGLIASLFTPPEPLQAGAPIVARQAKPNTDPRR